MRHVLSGDIGKEVREAQRLQDRNLEPLAVGVARGAADKPRGHRARMRAYVMLPQLAMEACDGVRVNLVVELIVKQHRMILETGEVEAQIAMQ